MMKDFRDFFGIDAGRLKGKKLWLFDLDGTVYVDDTLLPGALELLKYITDNDGRYVFITNNSSRSVNDYLKKAERIGLPAKEDSFYTSAQATALYLRENYDGKKIYCQGTRSFVAGLKAVGVDVTENTEKADVVVVGFDTEMTMEKLCRTCEILQTQDVVFLATNPDLACPVSYGFMPDCGSICAMIKNATGREPFFIGKPEPVMVESVMKKYGFTRAETVVVGDRLYTDILSGINAKVDAVCVLTGEATVGMINDGDIKPDLTFDNLMKVYEGLVD